MTGEEVTSDEAAAVFRRAAEIDQGRQTGDGRALDLAALEQAGIEAGLSRASIRQALAEVRAGALEPLVARPDAVVTRTLRASAAQVDRHVDRFMRQQKFRVVRRLGDRTVWEPDRSFGATVVKTLDINRRIVLREVSQLTTCVVAVPGEHQHAHMRFELDLARVRRGWYSMPVVLGGVGAAGVAVRRARALVPGRHLVSG
ncbi:MAG: hypothetical protein H0W70_09900, partial [Actinobacteria bacterium]|nr:hypothetical protein [Actinomycetota bacterium]